MMRSSWFQPFWTAFYTVYRSPALPSLYPRITKPIQQISGGKIIVLNGFPAAGKLTILENVLARLPEGKTHLMDNHRMIDPVVALYPDRDQEHYNLRRETRELFFSHISKLAQQGHVILMTACLAANNDTDAGVFGEHIAMVSDTVVPLYWITVNCDEKSLVERLQSPKRTESGKEKLTDVATLRDMLKENSLIQPKQSDDGSTDLVVGFLDVNGRLEDSVIRLMEMVDLSPGDEAELVHAAQIRKMVNAFITPWSLTGPWGLVKLVSLLYSLLSSGFGLEADRIKKR